MTVIEEIAAERQRQIELGYTEQRDAQLYHGKYDGEMAVAAATYALTAAGKKLRERRGKFAGPRPVPALWPWSWASWKEKARRRALIIAAALIVAEIERLDHKEACK